MTVANPVALHLAWLLIPLTACYLWRILPFQRQVSAEPIWKKTLAAQPRWNQFRGMVSFLSHLTIACSLIAAAADIRWQNDTGRPVILLVDVSASTQAGEAADMRFNQILAAVEKLVEKRPLLQEMAIVSVGSQLHWNSGFSTDRDDLRRSIPKRPNDDVADMSHAIGRMQQVLRHGFKPRIIVIGDGCYSLTDDQQQSIEHIVVGGDATNVGITSYASRQSATVAGEQVATIELTNQSKEASKVALQITVSDGESRQQDLDLGAEETRIVLHRFRDVKSIPYTVSTGQSDGFPTDNTVNLPMSSSRPIAPTVRILGNQIWQQRLAAIHCWQSPTDIELPDVTIVAGEIAGPFPVGNVLVLQPTGECEFWKGSELQPWDQQYFNPLDHPLTSGIRLDRIAAEEFYQLQFAVAPQWQLTSTTGESMFSLLETESNRLLIFHWNLEQSDLIRRSEFAVLLDKAVYFLADRNNLPLRIHSTGSVVRIDDPNFQSPVLLARENGGPTPANLASREESNLSPLTASDLTVEQVRLGTVASLSPWLLAMALALLVLEWRLFQKRMLS